MERSYKKILLRAFIAGLLGRDHFIKWEECELGHRIGYIREFLFWIKEFEKENQDDQYLTMQETYIKAIQHELKTDRRNVIIIGGPQTYPCTRKEIDEQVFGLKSSVDFTLTANPIQHRIFDESDKFRGKNKSKRKYPRPH